MNSYEKEHLELLRPYLSECCVLLKSKGDFPRKTLSRIALYGAGVRHTYKGGTGSGEVNSRFYNTVEKGFENAGVKITTKGWLDAYDKVKEEAFKKFVDDVKKEAKALHTSVLMMCMGKSMPAPEYSISMDGEGDTALYVVSRESGEGNDRADVKGEVLLSDTEIRDILKLKDMYEHFMLVLNVGGVVDLSPVMDVENILILSQLGVETGDALADIVLGKANPSGKLTTTWAAWKDYPELIEFGGYDETRYKEGIYVGYRYFDSADVKPLFPFGYGLSYTSFEIGEAEVSCAGETVTVKVPVKNTGAYAGKETVQVYVSAPAGELDKPYQVLAGFGKTEVLAAGTCAGDGAGESVGSCESVGSYESVVDITFKMSDIASYDEAKAAYVLESGDYIVRVGNSSRDTKAAAVITIDETVVVKQVKNMLGKPDFKDYVPGGIAGAACGGQLGNCGGADESAALKIKLGAADFASAEVKYGLEYEVDPQVAAMSDEDLLRLAMGNFDPKGGLTSMIGNAGSKVAGSAGDTAHVDGVKALVMADGPAGLRIAKDYFEDAKGVHGMTAPMPESMMVFAGGLLKWIMSMSTPKPKKGNEVKHQYCTAIPIGTAIAQSWNVDFASACGDIVGREMEIMGVDLWLAPALNIHRSIRCGRNFEYYSEDPLVSGMMAAAVTKGVQSHKGKGVTIKHYAANNQEFNRTSSNSIVSERALREIYLKGFEICVRESDPKTVMSSYNLINGVHTAESYELQTEILREEFGFKGFVMTDWVITGGMIPKDAKYKSPDQARVAAAGNDVYMPGSKDDFEKLKEGFAAGRVTRQQLMINATRVVKCGRS